MAEEQFEQPEDFYLSNDRLTRPRIDWKPDGRRFRVIGDDLTSGPGGGGHGMMEEREALEPIVDLEAVDDGANPWNIYQNDKGYFEGELDVPSEVYGLIIGERGRKKIEMENRTKTKINIPRREEIDSKIIITGFHRSSVERACESIMRNIEKKRMHMDATHFVSVPVNTEEIMKRYDSFRKDAVEKFNCPSNLFQTPMKLHLTIAVLKLLGKKEEEKISKLIDEFFDQEVRAVLQGKPLKLHLKGVDIMNDDPSSVDVLYFRVAGDGANTLKDLGQKLKEFLEKSGFGKKEPYGLKLHLTAMNSKYAVEESDRNTGNNKGRRNWGPKNSFDATKILDNFKNYELGSVEATKMVLACCDSVGRDGSHVRVSQHNF